MNMLFSHMPVATLWLTTGLATELVQGSLRIVPPHHVFTAYCLYHWVASMSFFHICCRLVREKLYQVLCAPCSVGSVSEVSHGV